MTRLSTASGKALAAIAAIAGISACSDPVGPPAQTMIVSPSVLSDTAMSAARPILAVTVLDNRGAPVPDARVLFEPPQPGSADPRPIGVQVTDHEAQADAAGVARTALRQWGPHAGVGWIRIGLVGRRGWVDSIRIEVRPGAPVHFGTRGGLYLTVGAQHEIPTGVRDSYGNEVPVTVRQCTTTWVPVTTGCRINAVHVGTDTIRVETSLGAYEQPVQLIRDGTIAASAINHTIIFRPGGESNAHPPNHAFYGSWLAGTDSLVHSVPDGGQVRVTDTRSGGFRTLATAARPASVPVASRDGEWIFFERDSAIWRIRRNRTGEERITPAGQPAAQPGASPQGTELIFVGAGGELTILNIATRTTLGLGVTGSQPRWSPVGGLIAYADPADLLALVTPAGVPVPSRPQQVLGGFDWSPDGAVIVGSTSERHVGPGVIITHTGYLWQWGLENDGFVTLPLVPYAGGSTSIRTPVMRLAWKR